MSALEMMEEEDEIKSVIVRLAETQQSGKPRPLCILSAFLGLLSTILAGLLIHTTVYNRLLQMQTILTGIEESIFEE